MTLDNMIDWTFFEHFLTMDFWGWMTVAFVFVAVELITLNTFTLWLALAASLISFIKLFVGIPQGWDWLLFAGLSLGVLVLAKRMFAAQPHADHADYLNQRGLEYVGQIFILSEPITNRRGRHLLDGVWWRLEGEDCPAGTTVRVVALDGAVLSVAIVS